MGNTYLVSSDLTNATDTYSKDALSNLSSEINNLVNDIDEFKMGVLNGTLAGKGYDVIFKKIDLYSSAFTKLANVCNVLSANITSANNYLLNYLNGRSSLNYSKLGEIETTYNRCVILLDYYSQKIKKPGESEKKVRNADAAESYSGIVEELAKEISVLKKFPDEISAASGMLSGIIQETTTFSSQMDSIPLSTYK